MKLIVGLGNPGDNYDKTRHNVGFMILDHYLGTSYWKDKFEAKYYEKTYDGEKVIFIKPQTYMNLSGSSVKKFANYFDVDLSDIFVIQDDKDTKFGRYKIKTNSGFGGHNGIKSIIDEFKSVHFGRLKVGIDNNHISGTVDHVLGKFSKEEIATLNSNMNLYIEIIESFINTGIYKTMNGYNKKWNDNETK